MDEEFIKNKAPEAEAIIVSKEEWDTLNRAIEAFAITKEEAACIAFSERQHKCTHWWIYTPIIAVCRKCEKIKGVEE